MGPPNIASIDDENPPSVVDGISAVLDGGEVLVTWRLDQRSFLDGEPPVSSVVVYEVVAFDFYWNESSPGGVSGDLS